MTSHVDLWTNYLMVDNWMTNIASTGLMSVPERWIVTAAISFKGGAGDNMTNLPATLETMRDCTRRGYRAIAGVAHPRIYEFEDWYKRPVWDDILSATARLYALSTEKEVVGFDPEPYRLRGRRYPLAIDYYTDGWRLTDALANYADWLRGMNISVLIQQAHGDHLLPIILRQLGVSVIWADSYIKEAAYGGKPLWRENLGRDTAMIASRGGKRWPTLTIKDWVTYDIATQAHQFSNGRINVFMNNTKDKMVDPMARYNYPLAGWADRIRDHVNGEGLV